MSEENTLIKNSEILFIFDAKETNPNGDLDNENRPRWDKDSQTNLVSDVRLKRYIRDYLKQFKDKSLFIDNDVANAEERCKGKKVENILNECIDIRLFGAVLATTNKDAYTGPIQFNWGYSLNKVKIRTNPSTQKFGDQRGMHPDYRVKYSLIAFSGNINGKNAINSKMTKDDLDLFDEAMVRGFSIMTKSTRSKIGQIPRLYLRVELIDDKSFLKDLREYIELTNKNDDLNDINGVKLDVTTLIGYLKKNNAKIQKIYYFIDDKLQSINKEDLEIWNGTTENSDTNEKKETIELNESYFQEIDKGRK